MARASPKFNSTHASTSEESRGAFVAKTRHVASRVVPKV